MSITNQLPTRVLRVTTDQDETGAQKLISDLRQALGHKSNTPIQREDIKASMARHFDGDSGGNHLATLISAGHGQSGKPTHTQARTVEQMLARIYNGGRSGLFSSIYRENGPAALTAIVTDILQGKLLSGAQRSTPGSAQQFGL